MKEGIEKKNRKGIIVIALLLVLFLTIGYAALTAQLTVTGTTKISGNSWGVELENVHGVSNQGATVTTAPTINTAKTSVNFSVTLAKPGDYYEFKVDAHNVGGINAKLGSAPTITGLTTNEQKFATYTITYGGTAAASVAANDALNASATKEIVVRVAYKLDVNAADMPTTEVTLTGLSLTLNYVQA